MNVPDWAKSFARLDDYRPAHLGYQNGCLCDRCLDRSARAERFRAEGWPNADRRAALESEDFFLRPWMYRDDGDGLPRPLREESACSPQGS